MSLSNTPPAVFVQWFSTLMSRLHEDRPASFVDVGPVKNVLLQVLHSTPFTQSLTSTLPHQLTDHFLVASLSHHTALSLSADQLEDVHRYLKSQIDTLVFQLFEGKDLVAKLSQSANTPRDDEQKKKKILYGGTKQSHQRRVAFNRNLASDYFVSLYTTMNQARSHCLRTAMHHRYPLLSVEGCSSISRPPVFYVTEGCPLYQSMDAVAWDLLISEQNFTVIPFIRLSSDKDTSDGNENNEIQTDVNYHYGMDLDFLQRAIDADLNNGRIPCAVLATYGADADQAYQSDNILALRRICTNNQIWLHCEGSSLLLATVCISVIPDTAMDVFDCADSIVFNPLPWFGLNCDSGVVLTRYVASTTTSTTTTTTGNGTGKQPSSATARDMNTITRPSYRTSYADFNHAFLLWFQLVCGGQPTTSSNSGTKINSTSTSTNTSTNIVGPLYIKHRSSRFLSQCLLLRQELKAVPFPVIMGPGTNIIHLVFFQVGATAVNLKAFNIDVNALNKYLFSRLMCCNKLSMYVSEIIYHGQIGFLFDPMSAMRDCGRNNTTNDDSTDIDLVKTPKSSSSSSSSSSSTSLHHHQLLTTASDMSNIRSLTSNLAYEIQCIQHCSTLRQEFKRIVESHDELQYIDINDIVTGQFVGLGALRFVPEYAMPASHLDALNAFDSMFEYGLLTHSLSLSSNASLYIGSITNTDIVCIIVQSSDIVFKKDCLEEIVSEIVSTASKLQLPPEVIDGIEAVVKKGIREAEIKLQVQQSKNYTPTALLAQIPIVGRMFSWFGTPTDPTPDSQGLKFDIRS